MCGELESASDIGECAQTRWSSTTSHRKFQPRLQSIESASGEIITETEKIAERWREYCM